METPLKRKKPHVTKLRHQLKFLFFGVHNIWNFSLKSVQKLYYNLPRWASIVFFPGSETRDNWNIRGRQQSKKGTATAEGAAATAETLATADTTVTLTPVRTTTVCRDTLAIEEATTTAGTQGKPTAART